MRYMFVFGTALGGGNVSLCVNTVNLTYEVDNMSHEKNVITTPLVLALGFVLVALVLVFSPGSSPTVVSGGEGAIAQNTISVSGNAEISVMPDLAKIYVAIELDEPTAKRAQDENARLTNTVRAALMNEFDLDEEDIQTSSYNIWPRQVWDSETRKYTETGYESRHVLEITTTDLDKVGDMLDTAIDNGATTVQSIQFGMTDNLEADVNDQVLGRAAANAESKANGLAQTLGVRVGGVASVTESNYYYQPYQFNTRAMVMEDAEMGGMAKSTTISPEEVTVRGSVQVSYLIA